MGQLVTITSAAIVRDGPSSSARIIGRAYAGANARVAATDSGWAQVEDAASGNKGWVESSILEPSTTTAADGRRLTWRRQTLGQKTSALLRLKTEMREASQSTPPKQNNIAQNITMDAAGSSSGSRFEVFSVTPSSTHENNSSETDADRQVLIERSRRCDPQRPIGMSERKKGADRRRRPLLIFSW